MKICISLVLNYIFCLYHPEQQFFTSEIYHKCGFSNQTFFLSFQNSVIKAGRETRAAEFQHFFENLNEKYKSVDESFKEKEDHLKSYYKQLESKLNLTAKPQQLSA